MTGFQPIGGTALANDETIVQAIVLMAVLPPMNLGQAAGFQQASSQAAVATGGALESFELERARIQREADAEEEAENEEDGEDGKQDEDDGLGLRRAWEAIYDLTGMHEEKEDE